MASIAKDPNGRKRILFIDGDGNRKAIRLGKMSLPDAREIKTKVEAILSAHAARNAIDPTTAQWTAEIPDSLAGKLARAGLIPARKALPAATLAAFLASYLDGRADLKPATKVVRGVVVRDLTGFFGEAREVKTITPGDADDFKQSLVARELAPTTIHKRLQVARSFFRAMKRRKLIGENPFDGVNAPAAGIRDRQRFVNREETARVLNVCPDYHWRCIVGLARFGGLRTPQRNAIRAVDRY